MIIDFSHIARCHAGAPECKHYWWGQRYVMGILNLPPALIGVGITCIPKVGGTSPHVPIPSDGPDMHCSALCML